ncbi:hypothetical protein M3Y94_00646400 [Aphelenchoides besseyi]|nr:hypothetical protein M3Y94_00646400 [Aphelenchoides besseyi]
MGFEYLRSIHGILSSIIVLLSGFAIFVGHFVWHNGDVYFLFVLAHWPLVTMTLVFLTAVWMTSTIVLLAQTLGKDLMEQLGKLKVLIIHAICALLICAAAVAESFLRQSCRSREQLLLSTFHNRDDFLLGYANCTFGSNRFCCIPVIFNKLRSF